MRNNLQWFQSPRPNSFNFAQTHQHQEQFPDLSQINPSNLTPTSIVHHPLSPFIPVNPGDRSENQGNPHNENEQTKNRGISHLVVFSEEEDDEEILTPNVHSKYKKNDELMTTGRKSSTEKTITGKKSRPKDKGLRGLSLKALNTVLQMKQGTYKQVATRLLTSFSEDPEPQRPANEETNIKRRVYDALNVLISLGLLKKEGRMIVGQKPPQSKKKEEMKECLQLREKLAIKEFILEEKLNKLKETQEKYKGVQGLFEGNKKNFDTVHKDNTYIPFPFVGVLTSNPDWQISQLTSEELQIKFKELVHPFGDIDSLRSLKKHFK